MRRRFYRFLQRALAYFTKALQPPPDHERENHVLRKALLATVETGFTELQERDDWERVTELIEARRMAGEGPWRATDAVLEETDKLIAVAEAAIKQRGSQVRAREVLPVSAQGAYGDIELALQNLEWRREINLSWLEFSRWGIQQIILISRLYYVKNPLIQRGINVAAAYVFGRGVSISSKNDAAAKVLEDFLEDNKSVLGQIALTDLERRKYYDGNLFFAFFADKTDTGKVKIRTIDAIEITEIVNDPDDSDKPQMYKREWAAKRFNMATGFLEVVTEKAWYPALDYEPTQQPDKIGDVQVFWNSPVLHRKCGGIAKWTYGCPLVYAALDWAKAARRFLEHVATVKQALAQISMIYTTKGGQQALMGFKQQLGTTVGPYSNAWDTNPPSVDGSIAAFGPGTKLEAFKSSGAGGDPEEVRRYILMVAIVFGLPETFFSDVKTGNLATAQSLDRPTELNFLEKQEAWVEDLTRIARFVIKINGRAPSGKIREAIQNAKDTTDIDVTVSFPSILEGDLKGQISAVVEAMTLGNKAGQIIGIDEREGVRELLKILDIEDPDDLINEMYPKGKYKPDRSEQDVEPPIGRFEQPGQPKLGANPAPPKPGQVLEALRRLGKVIEMIEARNGHDEHVSP